MNGILTILGLKSIPRAMLTLVGSLVLALGVISYRHYAFRRRLPPGPRGVPLVGNLFEIPKSHLWLT